MVNKLFALSDIHEGVTEDGALEILLDLVIMKLSYDSESHILIETDTIEI